LCGNSRGAGEKICVTGGGGRGVPVKKRGENDLVGSGGNYGSGQAHKGKGKAFLSEETREKDALWAPPPLTKEILPIIPALNRPLTSKNVGSGEKPTLKKIKVSPQGNTLIPPMTPSPGGASLQR